MQHSAFLCDIDLLTSEHSINALTQTRRRCQFQEQPDCVTGQAVLRVVQVDSNSFERKTLATIGIVGEKCAQVLIPYFLIMRLKGFPGRALCQRCWIARHNCCSSSFEHSVS